MCLPGPVELANKSGQGLTAEKTCQQARSHRLYCCKYRDSHKQGVNSNSRKDASPHLGEISEAMNPWFIVVYLACAQRCLLAWNRPQKTEGSCHIDSTMATQGRELRVAGRLPEPEPLFPHTNRNEGLKKLLRQLTKYRSGEVPKPVLAGQMWLARCLEGKWVRGQEQSDQRTCSFSSRSSLRPQGSLATTAPNS